MVESTCAEYEIRWNSTAVVFEFVTGLGFAEFLLLGSGNLDRLIAKSVGA